MRGESSTTIKSKKKKSNGVLYSVIALLFFFLCIFSFFLYHSHLQLGILHDFSSGSVNKQFVFNNIKEFLIADVITESSTSTPVSVTHSNNHEIISTEPPSKIKENNKLEIPKFDLSLSKNDYSNYLINLVKKELFSHDDAFTINDKVLIDDTRSIPQHVLNCSHGNGDLVKFWKVPIEADLNYRNPFYSKGQETKYVSFEPDVGGWNNIRMQMELVLVFAAATGRTLVLPPDQPMYLLNQGKGHQKAHNFADFFPFDLISKTTVPVITMQEYMLTEGISSGFDQGMYPPDNITDFVGTDKYSRNLMWEYLRNVSSAPNWKSMTEFVVIPPGPDVNTSLLHNAEEYRIKRKMFAAGRTAYYYDKYWQSQRFLHFISKPGMGYRLLEHFYTFIHFEDDVMDRYYKRFVRDYVHYIDIIFCKAALIVEQLVKDGIDGQYSAFHVRRGDFQYKDVKISAEAMMTNVGHLLPHNELLYIATDERNKSFFQPFRQRFPSIRFLEDFEDIADLKGINPNYLGMIDQVVCMRGRYFVGTWFSTFSGYITRMRGYYGYHDYSVWYADKVRRDRFHHAELPKFPFYMREWNVSWADIDH